MKYKKVAVVENFFDIIYDVHVNEGARGIKHAGQKRTHRTVRSTYFVVYKFKMKNFAPEKSTAFPRRFRKSSF